ncbi:MAG: hypothetical protein JXM69_00675 [Anaerolineae bacterium]|nr:hypothetical protein [Anaerolineae bacterium]
MMVNRSLRFVFFMLIVSLFVPAVTAAQTGDESDAVVRAVLFYGPTCPHCHKVITEVIIPLSEEYGDQLQVLGADTSQPAGSQLYQVAIDHFQIPPQRQGVPTLIIGETVLVGSGEIPAQFPTLVKDQLAAGGIDWPDIPGLVQAISASEESNQEEGTEESSPEATTEAALPTEVEATPQATATLLPTPTPTATAVPVADQSVLTIDKDSAPPVEEVEPPPPDPVGTALAAMILVGMVAALGFAIWRVVTAPSQPFRVDRLPPLQASSWVVPVLAVLGLGVATYLAYVEITHVEAVCGPVGECNIVQTSPYAQIMGIPIAVLGMLNYIAVIFLWLIQKFVPGRLANLSVLALAALTFGATLFSIYLTCLEIFAIHAVCAWCLSSAIISTLLMLLVVMPITGESLRLQPGASSA